jgi:hypothetical protein
VRCTGALVAARRAHLFLPQSRSQSLKLVVLIARLCQDLPETSDGEEETHRCGFVGLESCLSGSEAALEFGMVFRGAVAGGSAYVAWMQIVTPSG